jgi:hypothetical protein
VLDFIAQVGRGKGKSRTEARQEDQSRQEAEHIISLARRCRKTGQN